MLTTSQSLDIQYTVGLANGVPVEFLSAGGASSSVSDVVGQFLALADSVMGQENPPSVLTTSFGLDETVVPPDLAE